MALRLGDEVLHRGVLARLEVWSGGWGEADVALEDGPGLVRSSLPDGIVTGVAAAGQATLPAARALCTQDTGPYGATSQRRPSCSTGTTGLVRARPVLRPWVVSR